LRQVWIIREGTPERLEIRESEDPLPQDGELRIRVEATGLNFSDVLARVGLYPDRPKLPVVMGYEISGRVDAVGNGVETDWLGRNVLALTRFGGHSDVVCCPEIQVFSRPSGLNAESGAALPVNYLTAYQLLVVMGGLKKADTVLVHSAGGGVGLAVLQMSKRFGAQIIGAASKEKHEKLRELGFDHCIDYKDQDFVKQVRDLTSGKGVELALDAVGGKSFERSYQCLSRTGRLGMYGNSSMVTGRRRSLLKMGPSLLSTLRTRFKATRLINANKGVFGVNLGRLWEEPERVSSWMEEVLCWCTEGSIQPIIAARFPLEQASQAHQFLHDRKNIGKVLLIP